MLMGFHTGFHMVCPLEISHSYGLSGHGIADPVLGDDFPVRNGVFSMLGSVTVGYSSEIPWI